jgi:hypothetical protein
MIKKPRKFHSFAVLGYWNSPLTASFLHMSMHREGQIFIFVKDALPGHILTLNLISG